MRKVNDYNILGLAIQFILTIVVVVFFVLSFIYPKLYSFLYLFFALDMFAMGYNNIKVYRRGNVTILYFIVGVVMLVYSILSFIGVV